jgi:MscS family membrane protein
MRLRAIPLLLLHCLAASAQTAAPPAAPAPAAADALGRTTPRGTVLGFLKAMRLGDNEAAVRYLNTKLRGQAAIDLAKQLFVVLDTRLPARLHELSALPEGSIPFPAQPDKDLVGTIASAGGNIDILLERVKPRNADPIWLFSGKTLDAIPELYAEASVESVEDHLPAFLVQTHLAGVPIYQWLALFVGLPALILALAILNRFLGMVVRCLRRLTRSSDARPVGNVLPVPIRLLILALVIRWMLSSVPLPLIARQIWSNIAVVVTIVGCVWLACMAVGRIEARMRRWLTSRNLAGEIAVLRLGRRGCELLVVFAGLLVGLHHFGVNLTAAFAGLGVGGIAVALAAQKTLENVVGGVSIISDKAVRVGDSLKVGDTVGTVEDVGLRSTRIRTLDRTVVSVPNGQIATVNVENLSARDVFWFHPILRLGYETSAAQMRAVLEGVNRLLVRHPLSRQDSIRVRFLCFGVSSLDVEVFAYLGARDWAHFLELQEQLLLEIMEIVQSAGTRLALPAQTTYLTVSSGDQVPFQTARKRDRDAA